VYKKVKHRIERSAWSHSIVRGEMRVNVKNICIPHRFECWSTHSRWEQLKLWKCWVKLEGGKGVYAAFYAQHHRRNRRRFLVVTLFMDWTATSCELLAVEFRASTWMRDVLTVSVGEWTVPNCSDRALL